MMSVAVDFSGGRSLPVGSIRLRLLRLSGFLRVLSHLVRLFVHEGRRTTPPLFSPFDNPVKLQMPETKRKRLTEVELFWNQ